MQSARLTREVAVGRRVAMFGLFVSRLMAFCVLYFAPALAYVPPGVGLTRVPIAAAGDWVGGRVDGPAAETLDPKHRKDHGGPRQGEHGRGHIRAD